MNEFNWRGSMLLLVASAILILIMVMLTSGCVTMAKTQYREFTETPIPTPTPTPIPTPTPTPIPTNPISIPTSPIKYVDPFLHGERWQGQWFKWLRNDVQGINGEGTKDLYVGIVVYRHSFVDQLTYFDNLWGQYYPVKPSEGNRFFVVWIHEEMFGENTTFDPSMWIFDEKSFALQYKSQVVNNIYPVFPEYVIKEFENSWDYYNTVIAGPFGLDRYYTGHNPDRGGYVAVQKGYLRMGKGNSVDGYLIYEVPGDTMPEDMALLGNFATFGSAYWKFDV